MSKDQKLKVGQVFHSDDKGHRNCQFLKIVEIDGDNIVIQRYRDEKLEQPFGRKANIPEKGWAREKYTPVNG